MKGIIYPMIDDNIYEEEDKIMFREGVSREFKPGLTEDRQNVTRQRDPFYDDEPKINKSISLKPIPKEMVVKKNDTYNLGQEIKKKKIIALFEENKIT